MASVETTCWWRRQWPWSNSRQAWAERASAAVLLAGAGCLWQFGDGWPAAYQAILWALLLTASAGVIQRGWIKLVGPMLLYDLVRTARQRHVVVVRCVFGMCLLLGLFSVWAARVMYRDKWAPDMKALASSPALRAGELADLSFRFCYAVMGLQLLAALVLTPVYTAGAIAREKERRTLDDLLATDLRNCEIVLGMLVSRLANLALVFLMGLGILALLQLLSGVALDLLLAGYAVIGLTILSLGSLGFLSSVHARRLPEAVGRTYLAAVGYLAISSAARLLLPYLPLIFPTAETWTWPQEAVRWLCAGNIVTVLLDQHKSGVPLDAFLAGVLGDYAWFHLGAAAVCTGLAVLRLRARALKESAEPAGPRAERLPHWLRLRVGNWPIIWKEILRERGRRRGLPARLGIGLLVTATFIPAIGLFCHWHWLKIPFVDWKLLEDPMHNWARHATNFVGCLMLLQVSVRAAASISGERERQTLDALLTTPLNCTGIVLAKWLGSILSVRWTWCWLGSIWLTAYLLAGLSAGALPRVLLAWLAFAGFQAALGLCFSSASRSSLRATLWTLLTTVLLWFGHWLAWLALGPLFNWDTRHEQPVVSLFQEYSLTPPMALLRLSHKTEYRVSGYESGHLVWIGVGLWAACGLVLLCWAGWRLGRVTGRSSGFGRKALMRLVAFFARLGGAPARWFRAAPKACREIP